MRAFACVASDRISHAFLEGASHGIMIGHIVPEAAKGGPLALIRNGDMVVIDLVSRQLSVELSEFEHFNVDIVSSSSRDDECDDDSQPQG